MAVTVYASDGIAAPAKRTLLQPGRLGGRRVLSRISLHLHENGRADHKFASITTSSLAITLTRPLEATFVTNASQIHLNSSLSISRIGGETLYSSAKGSRSMLKSN
jgi:hypothetical protein